MQSTYSQTLKQIAVGYIYYLDLNKLFLKFKSETGGLYQSCHNIMEMDKSLN